MFAVGGRFDNSFDGGGGSRFCQRSKSLLLGGESSTHLIVFDLKLREVINNLKNARQ